MLKKKAILERASALNNAEKTLVLASVDPALTGKEQIAAYACTACGTHFASNPETEPFCVNCGAECHAEVDDVSLPDIPKTDEHLASVQCRNQKCGTWNIIHSNTAKVLSGVMHCITCGTALAYDNDFNNGGKDPANTRPPLENVAPPADTRPDPVPVTPADTGPREPDVKINMDHAGISEDQAEQQTEEKKAGEAQEQKAERAFEDDFDFENESDFDLTETAPLSDSTEEAPDLAETEDQMPSEPSEPLELENFAGATNDVGTPANVDMASIVLSNSPKAELSFTTTSDKMHAWLDDIHVATLSKETAGENADIMHTMSFAHTIRRVAQTEGVKAALKHYGFKTVTLKFPQSKVNAALVEKRTKETAAKFHERADQVREDFEQCVAIAATGLNRNYFAKHQNALKKGFVAALTASGVKGAERLVAGVFERCGDEYHRTLFEIASGLMKKPVEIRNELSDTLQQINAGATESATNEEADVETFEARLSNGIRPVAVASVNTAEKATAASVHSISAIREKQAGGKLFQ